MTYNEIKDKYQNFIYEKYEITELNDGIKIVYFFEIEGLTKFNPELFIPKNVLKNQNICKEYLNDLVFNIGMVELVSYWKCAMPKNIIVKAGYLDSKQINFFKKLYYNGLGEFRFKNNIEISLDDMVNIQAFGSKKEYHVSYFGEGNLVPIGGGKDSIVTLELLKNDLNVGFAINPKSIHYSIANSANVNDFIYIQRTLDNKLIELNNAGFLNGHTPFSALVSFISMLVAYLNNKKYIVLSNESSANEANIVGTNINHQYSKSLEYENDFRAYYHEYLNASIEYFSLLRPINEIQIAYLFSKYPKYFSLFKSCNVGSKNDSWQWCCSCPKCLFVYLMLSVFLKRDTVINIFGEDLLNKPELLDTLLGLAGKKDYKPFECVGTHEEVCHAIAKIINKNDNLPYLLKYYQDNYPLEINDSLLSYFDLNHNLEKHFLDLLERNLHE